MKFFECTRTNATRTAKFLKLEIYRLEIDYSKGERNQVFFGGIIKTRRINNPYNCHIEKDIKFFNIPVIKRFEDGIKRIYYFAGIPILKISLKKIFEKNYLKYINEKYDDIYILNANSGEIYLFLTYVLDALIKKNNSKSPLIIATKQYHSELAKIICPDIPCIFIKKLKQNIKDDVFKIKNFRFFMIFPHEHFIKVEMDIKTKPKGDANYFKSILERFDISEDEITMRKIKIPESDKQNALKKAKEINLNLNNFIFISPEARSCELIEPSYWDNLIDEYHSKGMDVFVNLADDSVKLNAKNYKTCPLTYSEVFTIASFSKKIIALRSGLCELMLQTGVEMQVIYRRFKLRHILRDMDKEDVMRGFGLDKIPDFKNISDTKILQENNQDELIVVKNLKGHSGCEILLCKKDETIFVRKKSSNIMYNCRLKKQYKKQKKYNSTIEIATPKIISSGYENGLFYFDMEFIRGKTLAEYIQNIRVNEISDYIKYLFDGLYYKNAKYCKNANQIFNKKINNLINTLENSAKLNFAFEILNKFNWTKVYKSPCHGDLTLENVLISNENKIYLFDFLDSFYNSWMFDIAKLLQDLELKWSFRNCSITTTQELHILIAKEALIKRILELPNGKDYLETIYHILLLNTLRIYPYTTDKKTIAYLDNSIEYLIKKLQNRTEVCV